MNRVAMSMLLCAAVVMLGAIASPAQAAGNQVTFTKDILPILQENCQTCHRPSGKNMSGMIAPMSLTTYQEVRPWAKSIAKAVENKLMPPWHASETSHGTFSNERTLSAEDIATIVEWVNQRAPRGNPKDAPAPIEFPEGWYMGEPDIILDFGEPFFVKDEVQDLYHNVTVDIPESVLSKDEWVQAIEFRPGSEVVHHIIAYATDPDVAYSEVETEGDVEGDEDFQSGRTMLGGLAPGTDFDGFPEGYGLRLKKGAEMTFAMHYHKEAGPGTGQWDNSIMAIKFADKPVENELLITTIAHGAFEIPPFHGNWVVSGAKTFEEDSTIISLMPHTHLRGVATTYTAFYPDGTSEELLSTPKYDFNWQTQYSFDEPKKIPAGTRIEFEIIYDNSEENAERVGFDPSRPIHFGGPTTDEMDLGWHTYSIDNKGVSGADD